MQAKRWALLALGLLLVLPAPPARAASYVLGDSLGLGVAQAAQVKGLARISVHIRGPRALEQFAQTPPNSTVYLVLGTNDAHGSIARLDKSIDDIVRTAEKKNIKLVWLGPPCVRQSWDTRARDLDKMLRERFANTSVRYVSMRDEVMCSGAVHERDGVHLKSKGYVHMWQKARAAAGETVVAAATAAATPVSARASAAPDHTSALKKVTVERIPLPPRRPVRPQT
jgi:hypothetical protein